MSSLVDLPLLLLALSLVTLSLCAWLGAAVFVRYRALTEGREEFSTVVAAALTLLGLIIGFTFSMAVSRYDQRKNYEEAEANAIGTEYLRADLLPAAEAAQTRLLLREYLGQRILFYTTRDAGRLRQIDADTARLQGQLWSAVRAGAVPPNAATALALGGMNDVLNSQGYTQAAWWNRIPHSAWTLMFAIAMLCNVMLGYATRRVAVQVVPTLVLPLLLSIAFFLIADIDSPRGGVTVISPQNLLSLAATLH